MYIEASTIYHSKKLFSRIDRFYDFCSENNTSLKDQDNNDIIARLIEFYNLDISIKKDREDIEFFRIALMI